MGAKNKIIAALDFRIPKAALEMANSLRDHVEMLKVGITLYRLGGPAILRRLRRKTGLEVMLDLKDHDIPQTVSGAARATVHLGVTLFTVHCDGGLEMMTAAREAVDRELAILRSRQQDPVRPRILGVAMLTSKKPEDLERDGLIRLDADAPPHAYQAVFDEIILRRALLAEEAGLDGVVASPRYVKYIRKACRPGFFIVSPGIHMIETAGAAIRDGADYVVIGRLFSQSRDPVGVAGKIAAAVAAALAERERTP